MTDTQTSSARPARRVHDGFTLIELMRVLALITLLMWMAVPRSSSPRHPLNKRC